jgi:hypothetical protein
MRHQGLATGVCGEPLADRNRKRINGKICDPSTDQNTVYRIQLLRYRANQGYL